MDVSKNRGTPKSSILIGFSIINHPFSGTPIFGNTHIIKVAFASFGGQKVTANTYTQFMAYQQLVDFCRI